MRDGRTDTLIDEFVRAVCNSASAINSVMKQPLRSQGQVTLSRLRILRLLAGAGVHHVGGVARPLGVGDAAASKAVDKLVRQRLLRRVRNQADRRTCELPLTVSGRQLLSDCEESSKRLLEEACRGCSSLELHGAVELLDRLSARILAHWLGPGDADGRKVTRKGSIPADAPRVQGGL